MYTEAFKQLQNNNSNTLGIMCCTNFTL